MPFTFQVTFDTADPHAQARWWAGVYGVSVTENDGWFTLEGVPGMPILTMDFVPVPEGAGKGQATG